MVNPNLPRIVGNLYSKSVWEAASMVAWNPLTASKFGGGLKIVPELRGTIIVSRERETVSNTLTPVLVREKSIMACFCSEIDGDMSLTFYRKQ